MSYKVPGEVELFSYYSIHLGPRFESAGLRIQFHYNQTPGIHFKVSPPEEYREAIVKGLQEGMDLRFPDFPDNGSIWILEITSHKAYSSKGAFHRVSRMVIDQAFLLTESRHKESSS